MPHTAALIGVLILERPMCLPCVAAKAHVSETQVAASVARLALVVRTHRQDGGHCRACGKTGVVVSLTRPEGNCMN